MKSAQAVLIYPIETYRHQWALWLPWYKSVIPCLPVVYHEYTTGRHGITYTYTRELSIYSHSHYRTSRPHARDCKPDNSLVGVITVTYLETEEHYKNYIN